MTRLVHGPFRCVYSPEFYREVGAWWRGRSFVQLALVLAVCSALLVAKMFAGWAGFMRTEGQAVIAQIPEITIEQGKVSTNVPQPHYIRASDGIVAVIDTTGQIRSLRDTEAPLLLTEDELIVRKNEHQTQTVDLSEIESFYLDRHLAADWAKIIGNWAFVVMYPFCFIGSFAYRVVQVLFYSLFGLLLVKSMRARLHYPAILSLTAVAIIPAIFLKTAFIHLELTFPFSWLLLFAVAMACLAAAIKANAPSDTLPLPDEAPPLGPQDVSTGPHAIATAGTASGRASPSIASRAAPGSRSAAISE